MRTWVFTLLLALAATDARADVAYTITLSDDEAAVVEEQARLRNATPRAEKQSATGFLRESVRTMVRGWEKGQVERTQGKEWKTRSDHERRVACRALKLDPCPK